MELFQSDSVPDLTIKNLGNSPSSPSVSHATMPAKQFKSYGILKTDLTAEFCFWTEQQLNRTQLLGLGLT
jgi:hypothetical protein